MKKDDAAYSISTDAAFKAKEMMFIWRPNSDQVKVGPWPDNTGWAKHTVEYPMSSGACYSDWHDMSHEQLKTMLFIEAIHLIVRDRVDADSVHREFCKIDEYRDGLSGDLSIRGNHDR